MYDITTIIIVAGTFLIAGTVKGVIGFGLPLVSLGLLTLTINLPEAMSLLLVPSFVTNFWQAISGGNGKIILRRLWLFLISASITVWIGVSALRYIELELISAVLGTLIVIYSSISLIGLRPTLSPRQEFWLGPIAGWINGLLAGMTGSFVVPGVIFLQAIKLPRNMLNQAMGMLFTLSTIALASALERNNFLTPELGILSTAALLPAAIGMFTGQLIKEKMSEQMFLRLFFTSLLSLGAYIIANSLNSL